MAALPKRSLAVNVGLAVALVVVAFVGWKATGKAKAAPAAVRTTTVLRGAVQATVTATGNVQAPMNLNVNFGTGGTLVAVYVKQGDQVQAGQPLAKVDSADAQSSLTTAQANLTTAQDKLRETEQGLTPAQQAQNSDSLAQSQLQLQGAQQSLANAQNNAAVDQQGLQRALDQANNQLNADVAACATPTTSSGTGTGGGQSCSDKLAADQNTVNSAQQAFTAGVNKDQQAIQSAQQAVATAQLGLQSTQDANAAKAQVLPSAVAAAQAGVTQAQNAVTSAQKAVDATTLTAPAAGTVASINGVVGQTVSGGASNSSSSSSSGSTGGAATGASSSSSTGSGFITLTDLSGFQVKASFAEADAVKVQVGQPATVSLDAVPSEEIAGRVVQMDTSSTVSSNVVTYGVVIDLNDPPAGTKPGMTANVTVITASRADVLRLPSADVRRGAGNNATVVVMEAGKQVTKAVTVGLKGDDATEILSGVNQGDTVVEPALSLSTTATTTAGGGPRLGGGGLGGGGRFGG